MLLILDRLMKGYVVMIGPLFSCPIPFSLQLEILHKVDNFEATENRFKRHRIVTIVSGHATPCCLEKHRILTHLAKIIISKSSRCYANTISRLRILNPTDRHLPGTYQWHGIITVVFKIICSYVIGYMSS
jgi:hypothetical protein